MKLSQKIPYLLEVLLNAEIELDSSECQDSFDRMQEQAEDLEDTVDELKDEIKELKLKLKKNYRPKQKKI